MNELMSVRELGKAYRSYHSEWQRIAGWFYLPSRPSEEHWVLRHINFSIEPGEAIGIVGQNGAGKSTLLKLITGTLQPTEGSVQVRGRIAAILELGMGFNPELTGRQNVMHAGGLMGFSVDQIKNSMPDIEAFAEVGDYFDQPVRAYSSGMQMRVAFSVATAFRPEILIVDEALSVGDAYFQHKCFARIREFQKHGTTLLIVSHDREAIQVLCNRAILLDKGAVIRDGNPEDIMDFYNALIADKENSTIKVEHDKEGQARTISGTGQAHVEALELLDEKGEPIEFVKVGQHVRLRVCIRANDDLPDLVFGYMLKDRLGQTVYGTNTYHLGIDIKNVARGSARLLEFCFAANLGVGSYSVTTALHVGDTHVGTNYEWCDRALIFNVMNIDAIQFVGMNWLPPQCKRLESLHD